MCRLTAAHRQIGYNQATVSAEQRPQEFHFDLSGGHLALDFANTLSRRDSPEKNREHLSTARDLISFARQTALLPSEQAAALTRNTESHSRVATQALREAIAFREAIFHTFLSLATDRPVFERDVQLIEKSAQDALRHRHIVGDGNNYRWRWDEELGLQRILWPIAQSAAELLTSPDLKKVRECQASDCFWLFLDNSRNRSRRWCSMDSCGNREKARRHYHRQREHE